jgi:hypothetical protein
MERDFPPRDRQHRSELSLRGCCATYGALGVKAPSVCGRAIDVLPPLIAVSVGLTATGVVFVIVRGVCGLKRDGIKLNCHRVFGLSMISAQTLRVC